MTLSAARNDIDETASMQPAKEASSRGIRSDVFMGHPFDWCSLDLHSRRVGNGVCTCSREPARFTPRHQVGDFQVVRSMLLRKKGTFNDVLNAVLRRNFHSDVM